VPAFCNDNAEFFVARNGGERPIFAASMTFVAALAADQWG
jgi:hypothetical protein